MSRKLIKFGTDWCGGCRQIKPLFEQLKAEGYPIEEYNPEIDVDIRKKYRVNNLPLVIAVEADGTEVGRLVGRKSKEAYIELLNS